MVQFFVFMIDGNRRHHSPPEPGTRGVSARASRTSSPALAAASSALIWAKVNCSPSQLSYDFRSRSEEHTSELQSLMRISYAVFCLKNKTTNKPDNTRLVIQKSLKHV